MRIGVWDEQERLINIYYSGEPVEERRGWRGGWDGGEKETRGGCLQRSGSRGRGAEPGGEGQHL